MVVAPRVWSHLVYVGDSAICIVAEPFIGDRRIWNGTVVRLCFFHATQCIRNRNTGRNSSRYVLVVITEAPTFSPGNIAADITESVHLIVIHAQDGSTGISCLNYVTLRG